MRVGGGNAADEGRQDAPLLGRSWRRVIAVTGWALLLQTPARLPETVVFRETAVGASGSTAKDDGYPA